MGYCFGMPGISVRHMFFSSTLPAQSMVHFATPIGNISLAVLTALL